MSNLGKYDRFALKWHLSFKSILCILSGFLLTNLNFYNLAQILVRPFNDPFRTNSQ